MYIPEEEYIENFYTDIVNSTIFGTPISYLSKYPFILDYTSIVNTEDEIHQLIEELVSNSIEKNTKIAEFLEEKGIGQRARPFLAKVIANKMPDLKQTILRKQISQGGAVLLDNNWRVINVQSTSWNASANRFLLNLTIILEENSGTVTEVPLEMNVHQAEQFLSKLQTIKQSLKI